MATDSTGTTVRALTLSDLLIRLNHIAAVHPLAMSAPIVLEIDPPDPLQVGATWHSGYASWAAYTQEFLPGTLRPRTRGLVLKISATECGVRRACL